MENEIESKTTFLATPDGKRIPLRSMLEARWAVFFTELGVKWHYEPKTFRLPSGEPYTPDFLVESVGWFEIKPTMEKLYDGRAKMVAFCKAAKELLNNESARRYFVSVGRRPSMQSIMLGYAPEKEVALVTTFWKASSWRRSSFANYRSAVLGRAKAKADAFTQSEVTMREIIFAIRHEDFGASFRKLTNDYLGGDEFPLTLAELERGSLKHRSQNLVNESKNKKSGT